MQIRDYLTRRSLHKLSDAELREQAEKIMYDDTTFDPEPPDIYVSDDEVLELASLRNVLVKEG